MGLPGVHAESNAVFNDNMTALSFRVAHAVAEAYDFSGLSRVVDVGGGQGSLLEEVLKRNEHLSGTVFDLAHVVTPARAEAMPASVATCFSVESGSFFDAVPPVDAYLLKSILHDWPDDRCVQILRSCARSLTPGGVVLLVETARPPRARGGRRVLRPQHAGPSRRARADRAAVRDALRRRRAPTEPDPRHDVPLLHRRGQVGAHLGAWAPHHDRRAGVRPWTMPT
jgi:SAM-dependent methyltransferase